jgi:uncharacterized protein YndB with AHSA1/START domain
VTALLLRPGCGSTGRAVSAPLSCVPPATDIDAGCLRPFPLAGLGIIRACVAIWWQFDTFDGTREKIAPVETKGGLVVRVEHSLVIERPPAEVFSYTTDPGNLPEWQSTALEARSEGPIQQGARVTEVRKFLGRRMESEVEVTGYELNRRFELEVLSGPVPFTFEQTLEPTDGGTRVKIVLEGEPGGFFKLAEPLVERAVRRQVEADFEQLKDILEARSS